MSHGTHMALDGVSGIVHEGGYWGGPEGRGGGGATAECWRPYLKYSNEGDPGPWTHPRRLYRPRPTAAQPNTERRSSQLNHQTFCLVQSLASLNEVGGFCAKVIVSHQKQFRALQVF